MMTPLRLINLLPFVVAGGLWLAGFWGANSACPPVSMQRLAVAAAGGFSVWLFARFLQVLTPGTHTASRLVYATLLLALSPVFGRTGAGCDGQLPCLLLVLLFLLAATKTLDHPRLLVWWGFGGLCVWGIAYYGAAPGLAADVFSSLSSWSWSNLFRPGFGNASEVMGFALPNGFCVLFYPLMHPGFCLLLPGLFLLFKKTDLHLPSKKLLWWSLVCCLLAVGGLPQARLSNLLPAYLLWLLLFFPAWDRFFSYGFYFFPRLAWGLLLLLGFFQFIFLATGA